MAQPWSVAEGGHHQTHMKNSSFETDITSFGEWFRPPQIRLMSAQERGVCVSLFSFALMEKHTNRWRAC